MISLFSLFAHSIDPTYIEALLCRGFCFFVSRMVVKAFEDFNKAVEIDHNNINALLSRGNSFFFFSCNIIEVIFLTYIYLNRVIELFEWWSTRSDFRFVSGRYNNKKIKKKLKRKQKKTNSFWINKAPFLSCLLLCWISPQKNTKKTKRNVKSFCYCWFNKF